MVTKKRPEQPADAAEQARRMIEQAEWARRTLLEIERGRESANDDAVPKS